ncbi:hypothetical protein ACQ3I4_06905 [Zafaria sp. Z1313]|uniref:hypothetical protein n=1 Tax=Zafaria sp. Z1313 TaxID=3423202 RepID=UPI003D303AF3
MKNRSFWTITGALGVVAVGAGAAVADTDLFNGTQDLGSGIQVAPAAEGGTATQPAREPAAEITPATLKDSDFTQRGASAASPASPGSPASPASPGSPASAPSPASPASPASAASPASPASAASPASPASPVSAASPVSPVSPASAASAQSAPSAGSAD